MILIVSPVILRLWLIIPIIAIVIVLSEIVSVVIIRSLWLWQLCNHEVHFL
jgi:hypothetical protein